MRQLFREMRKLDQQQAPPFASVLERAVANPRQATFAWQVWRLVAAVGLVILVVGSALLFNKLFSTPPTFEKGLSALVVVPDLPNYVAPAPSASESYADVPKKLRTKNSQYRFANQERSPDGRPKQRPPQNRQLALLISKWQSPTAALLKTPGAEFLKNIPKVGEPLVEMKNLFPSEKN